MRLTEKLSTMLVCGALCVAQDRTPQPQLYMLAATPTVYFTAGYPAKLYLVNERQKLVLMRQLVTASEGVAFVLAGADFLAIGSPTVSPTSLKFVHFESPWQADSVDYGAEMGATPLGSALFGGAQMPWAVGLFNRKDGVGGIFGMDVEPPADAKKRGLHPVDWGALGPTARFCTPASEACSIE